MKKFLLIAALLICAGCSKTEKSLSPQSPAENIVGEISIIPQPYSVRRIGGQFTLNTQTKIVAADDSARQAAATLNQILLENYGFALDQTDETNLENTITFSTGASMEGSNADEGYILKIEPGFVRVSGTGRGMFYAVQSLAQLFPQEFSGDIHLPAAEITDAPRFAYRGMHLDVGRHFMPPEFIKKYIALIAQYKFNYFHWHLTDDQGWRIEIKKYPELTKIGSKRRETVVASEYKKNNNSNVGDGDPVEGFYTQEEIRDIVAFANANHVTIIPEIDLPGHSSAALAAYRELGCKQNYPYKIKTTWGGFPDVLCPTEQTFQFIEDVLGEVIDMFPDSPYVHIGGDEVMLDQWRESGFVQELKRRENLNTEKDVQSWFIRRVENFVNSRGKKIIGWDEIFADGVAPGATIMSWRGVEPGMQAARAGHNVIIAPYDNTYFDHPQGEEKEEPLAQGKQITLEDVYKFDPAPSGMAPNEAANIIGAQGCVWTEFIKLPKDVEYMAFPRALALAEVLWSKPQTKNFANFLQRLNREFPRLDRSRRFCPGCREENVNYRIPKPLGLNDRRIFADEKAPLLDFKPIPNSKIYFTMDGTSPNTDSKLYQNPFVLLIAPNQTIELKAKVISANGRESRVFTATYFRQPSLAAERNLIPDPRKQAIK